MRSLYRQAVDLIDAGRPFGMAVILDTDGSTPQGAGVRAIIDTEGNIRGTIGGGIVEAETRRHAIEACRANRARVVELELRDAYSRDAMAICGGRLRILIDPTAGKHREAYRLASETVRARDRGVLVTVVRHGEPPEIHVTFEMEHSLSPDFPHAHEIRTVLAREIATVITTEPDTTILIEPVIPAPSLVIAGAGYIGAALARMAATLGFEVTVIDDRPEFTAPELFPEEVATRCGDIAREIAGFPSSRDVYIVIVTRGHKEDAEALEACIHSPAVYIGMIGSKRKITMIRKNFIESGLATEAEFDRVFAPIGLDIGAVTVPEIAVSIAAELVAVRRKGPAQQPRRVKN